jgi:outer membrane protein TolC
MNDLANVFGVLKVIGYFSMTTLMCAPCFGEIIDLKRAIELGLANSPSVREATEKVNQSRYEKYVSRSSLLPVVSLKGTAAQKKDSVADRASVPFGGEAYKQYSVGLHGEQTLLAYGFFSAGRIAEFQEEIETENLEITKRNLSKSVILSFYKTLMNENLVRLLEDQEKGVRDILTIAQRRYSLGGKRIDVLQIKTRLALLKPKIDKAKNDLASSTAELAQLLGRADHAELKLSGQIPAVALKSVEQHLDFAKLNIPELNQIRLQREQMAEAKSAALGKHLPDLKLTGDYNFASYTKGELFDPASKSWAVYLVLNIPLFSGFSSFSERNALASQEAQLAAQEENRKNNVSLRQIISKNELGLAEASLASATEAAALAKESLDEARREYKVGLVDFLQFFQVESANYEATTALLQLKYDVIGAYANYFIYSGQPLSVLIDLLAKEGNKT